jgi:hypothetical protein
MLNTDAFQIVAFQTSPPALSTGEGALAQYTGYYSFAQRSFPPLLWRGVRGEVRGQGRGQGIIQVIFSSLSLFFRLFSNNTILPANEKC